ncbi:MAG: hypothetical protein AB7P21_28185 [Lautropia sp.]
MHRRDLLLRGLALALAGCASEPSPEGVVSSAGAAPDEVPVKASVPVDLRARPRHVDPAASSWPVARPVGTHPAPPLVVAQGVPPYLEPVADLATAPPIASRSSRPTRLTRVSDARAFARPLSGPDWNNFGPQYTQIQHWSGDGSMLVVRALGIAADGANRPHDFYTSLHLLDGRTGAYLRPCIDAALRGLSTQWLWSNAVADEMLFVEAPRCAIQTFVPSSSTFGVLKVFDGYDALLPELKGLNESQSDDGRFIALMLQKDAQWHAVVWDRSLDAFAFVLPVPATFVEHRSSISISPSGAYVVIGSLDAWPLGATVVPAGISVFDRASGQYLRTLGEMHEATHPMAHGGCGVDAHGNDVWVHFWGPPRSALDERCVRSWRLDGSSVGPGRAECEDGIIAGLDYLTTVARGWVLVSDYPMPTENASWNAFPMRGHVWALRLDGSGATYPIVPERISHTDHAPGVNGGYWWYPWATPNRSLTQVLFRSGMSIDWSGGVPPEFHAYLATA